MKKKNKDLIPLLVIGAGGLYLLSGSKKSSGGSAPPPPSGGGSAPPPPTPGGGGSSSPPSGGSQSLDMYQSLEKLGYAPRVNLSTSISSFQKDYNNWKDSSILLVDGEWGPDTYGAVDEAISTFGDLSKWRSGATGATNTPATAISGVKVYTDKDWSLIWGDHYHPGTMVPTDERSLPPPGVGGGGAEPPPLGGGGAEPPEDFLLPERRYSPPAPITSKGIRSLFFFFILALAISICGRQVAGGRTAVSLKSLGTVELGDASAVLYKSHNVKQPVSLRLDAAEGYLSLCFSPGNVPRRYAITFRNLP